MNFIKMLKSDMILIYYQNILSKIRYKTVIYILETKIYLHFYNKSLNIYLLACYCVYILICQQKCNFKKYRNKKKKYITKIMFGIDVKFFF